MRRTKSEKLWPAAQVALAQAGFYKDPNDTPGVSRVDAGGRDKNFIQDAPTQPSLPLMAGSGKIVLFDDLLETLSDTWDISEVGSGTQANLFDTRRAEMVLELETDTSQWDSILFRHHSPTFGFLQGKPIWARFEFNKQTEYDTIDRDTQIIFGMTPHDDTTPNSGYFSGGNTPDDSLIFGIEDNTAYATWKPGGQLESYIGPTEGENKYAYEEQSLSFHWDGNDTLEVWVNDDLSTKFTITENQLSGFTSVQYQICFGIRNHNASGSGVKIHVPRVFWLKGDR